MKVKNVVSAVFLLIGSFFCMPIVNAANAEPIGDTNATIAGDNYTIDFENRIVNVHTNASIELSGDAGNYRISVDANAVDVTITLKDYTAITGGWSDAFVLLEGSDVLLNIKGENYLQAGNESSAIRVPEGTSLTIQGDGKLHAAVDNGSSMATSAVIGSVYNYPFGTIIINSGTIETSFTGGGTASGIGTGHWNSEAEPAGTLILNGGIIKTDVLGSTVDDSNILLEGSGKAIIYTDNILAQADNFNGIVYNTADTGTVRGNATIDVDISIPEKTTLTIPEDSTLTVPANITVMNRGSIANHGTIINMGVIQNENELTNDGTIYSATEIENIIGNDFKPVTYQITITGSLGGTVSPSESITIEHGQSQTFNIVPDSGYQIKNVLVNGIDKTSEIVDNEFILQNITEDIQLQVEFELIPESEIIENPATLDSIFTYLGIALISLMGLFVSGLYIKKNRF